MQNQIQKVARRRIHCSVEEEAQQCGLTTVPWPKPNSTPIIRDLIPVFPDIISIKTQKQTKYMSCKYGDPWAAFNSTCYNGLLRVEMIPTMFIYGKTLYKMGIL